MRINETIVIMSVGYIGYRNSNLVADEIHPGVIVVASRDSIVFLRMFY